MKTLKQTNDLLDTQVKILTTQAVEQNRRLEAIERLLGTSKLRGDAKGKEKVTEEEEQEKEQKKRKKEKPEYSGGTKRRFLEDEVEEDEDFQPSTKRIKPSPGYTNGKEHSLVEEEKVCIPLNRLFKFKILL